MKSLKLLIAYVAVLFTVNTVKAQSVIPAFEDPIYGGWLHVTEGMTCTLMDTIIVGNPTIMARVIEIKPHATWGTWSTANSVFFNAGGVIVDSIDIVVPFESDSWDVRFTYSTQGGWLFTHTIEQVEIKPMPTAAVQNINRLGSQLHFQTNVTRFNANENGQFEEFERIILWSDDIPVDTIIYQVSSAGDFNEAEPFYFNLTPWVPAGQLCITVEVFYWHNSDDGYSDFGPRLIASDQGCDDEPWLGFSTDVHEGVECKPCEMKVYPSPAPQGSTVTIENLIVGQALHAFDSGGRLVQTLMISSPSTTVTMGLVGLSSGVYQLVQASELGERRACELIVQ